MPTTFPERKTIKKEVKLPEPEAKEAIGLPIFIMILLTAIMADLFDLVEAIPVVGQIIGEFGVVFDFILWTIYWACGARGITSFIAMGLDTVAKAIPVVNILPFNTITAILVYIMSQGWFKKTISAATSLGGGLTKKIASYASDAAKMSEQIA